MKSTLTILALATAIVLPALADDGVMPQQSRVIVNDAAAQQGVGAGKGAFSGKRHAVRHGKKMHHKAVHHGKRHHVRKAK